MKVISEAGMNEKPIENINDATMPSAVPLRESVFYVSSRG